MDFPPGRRGCWPLRCPAAGGGQPRPGLRLRLNQVAWASTLGATRESINKQLAQLRTAGVMVVGSLAVLLVVLNSPPPATAALFVTLAGALAATLTVSTSAG